MKPRTLALALKCIRADEAGTDLARTPFAPQEAHVALQWAAPAPDEIERCNTAPRFASAELEMHAAITGWRESEARTRAAWTEAESQRLAEQIDSQLSRLASVCAREMALSVAPLLLSAIEARTLDELAREVARLAPQAPALIKLCGRGDLIISMQQKLAGRSYAIVTDETDSTDVEITIDQTTLRSNLEEWAKAFNGLLEPSIG